MSEHIKAVLTALTHPSLQKSYCNELINRLINNILIINNVVFQNQNNEKIYSLLNDSYMWTYLINNISIFFVQGKNYLVRY